MDANPHNEAASGGDSGASAGKTELVAYAKIEALKNRAAQWRPKRVAWLATSIALAAALGSAAGVFAGLALTRANEPPDAKAVRGTIARLSSDIAALKVTLDASGKSASVQIAKIADRFERAEKAQAEPAAKLARIAEAVDRLEKKPPEVTGSSVDKQQQKPPVLEGWVLRDIYDGRALVESRNGLFEIAPGSNLPGVGRIENIKRQDGRWVVVTPKGLIVSSRF